MPTQFHLLQTVSFIIRNIFLFQLKHLANHKQMHGEWKYGRAYAYTEPAPAMITIGSRVQTQTRRFALKLANLCTKYQDVGIAYTRGGQHSRLSAIRGHPLSVIQMPSRCLLWRLVSESEDTSVYPSYWRTYRLMQAVIAMDDITFMELSLGELLYLCLWLLL